MKGREDLFEIQQVKDQLELAKRMYQLCSLLIAHLERYEDTTRFENILIEILNGATQTPFKDVPYPTKKEDQFLDPTTLI